MVNRVIVCGGNGAGKSTLGKTLAEAMGYKFADIEDYYFDKTDPDYRYASARTRDQVSELLLEDMKQYPEFVLASVTGNYGDEIVSMFTGAVWISVPKDIRMKRVKDRSFQKFGDRIFPGGDLYEKEKRFFDMVEHRREEDVEDWLKSLRVPVIRVDGTKPVDHNVEEIMMFLRSRFSEKSGQDGNGKLEERLGNTCRTELMAVKGDITQDHNVQAIVNAANTSLLGGGGVDGAIHRAAGRELLEECRLLNGCKTGKAKITKAYHLPCEYIIHTPGPHWNGGKSKERELLASSYRSCLELAVENGIRSVAFPSISTGIYHFPVAEAAKIAVDTVKRFISANPGKLDIIKWILFDDHTFEIYENELRL